MPCPEPAVCRYCGATFTPAKAQAQRGLGVPFYCGAACRKAGRKRNVDASLHKQKRDEAYNLGVFKRNRF